MLCINYDLTRSLNLKKDLDEFLSAQETGADEMTEEPDQTVMEIIDGLIIKTIGDANVRELPRRRLVELVKFMDEKGIFLVKGAMDKVANLMEISKVTLYSYLDEAKGKR